MELTLILGSFALVAAIGMLWWGVTARPSAARSNLFADLPDPAPEPSPLVAGMRHLGASTRRLLPNAMVDGLEVNLVRRDIHMESTCHACSASRSRWRRWQH